MSRFVNYGLNLYLIISSQHRIHLTTTILETS